MKLSVVVNTCALGPRAAEITGSCSLTPHASRAFLLDNLILPFYAVCDDIDEVFVVGEWRDGPSYTYIHSPSTHFSCVDALTQRQLGAEAATGDVVIFQHDDHVLDFVAPSVLQQADLSGMDIMLPARYKRYQGDIYPLANGADEGYVSGHVVAMTRDALTKVAWKDVALVHDWDVSLTMLALDAGLNLTHAKSGFACWDVEFGVRGTEESWEEVEENFV